jgi:hypothetical protein
MLRTRTRIARLSGALGIPVDPCAPTIEELAAESEAGTEEGGDETGDEAER